MLKALLLKPDDSVAVIHWKAEALQLVPDPRDQNPLPTDRSRQRLRLELERIQLTREDKCRLKDVSAIDKPGLQRELQVMQAVRSGPLLLEIDKAAKQAFVLNCPAKYLAHITGTQLFLETMQQVVADVGLTAQQQMQSMVQRLTVPRSLLMGDQPDGSEDKKNVFPWHLFSLFFCGCLGDSSVPLSFAGK